MSVLRVASCALILAATFGGRSEAAPPGAFRLDDMRVGHHECPGGGAVIRLGSDDDRDGVLDRSELDRSESICQSPPPQMKLGNSYGYPLLGHCPAGGIVLPIGLDLDRDRRIDAHEVERVVYACNQQRPLALPARNGKATGGLPVVRCGDRTRGPTPDTVAIARAGDLDDPPLARAVLRRDVEAPGDRCPHGGTAFRTGLDGNGNGALDDREVERTTYMCPPVPVLAPLRVRPVPAGRNCPAGGAAIETGMDDDASGVLDGGEVDATHYLCTADDLIEGDVRIDATTSRQDLARIARARAITGHLAISAPFAVELPALSLVGGAVIIADGATTVRLPALTAVSRDVIVRGGSVIRVALPALAIVGDRLRIEDAPALATVVLPALERVGGDVRLAGAPALSAPRLGTIGRNLELRGRIRGPVAMPALVEVDRDLVLRSLGARVDLPRLVTVQDLRIEQGFRLDALVLPSLRLVRGSLLLSWSRLARLSLPALERVFDKVDVGGRVRLVDGGVGGLVTVELPGLVSVGTTVTIENAPRLSTLNLGQLATVGGRLRLHELPRLRTVDLRSIASVKLGDLLWIERTGLIALSLSGLQVGDGIIVVRDNAQLTTIDLGPVTAACSLLVENSDALVSLSAASLVAVTADVIVRNAPRLRRLVLPVTRVRALHLDNVGLASVGALEHLTEAFEIVIRRNQRLASVGGLRQLSRVSRVAIDNNPRLPAAPGVQRLAR